MRPPNEPKNKEHQEMQERVLKAAGVDSFLGLAKFLKIEKAAVSKGMLRMAETGVPKTWLIRLAELGWNPRYIQTGEGTKFLPSFRTTQALVDYVKALEAFIEKQMPKARKTGPEWIELLKCRHDLSQFPVDFQSKITE